MAQSNNTQADVVIIGAGISGLCTAYHLKKRNENLRYVVLEAKDRIGGRTLGKKLKSKYDNENWDYGGSWIGSCQPHIMDLLSELGLEVYNQYIKGKKVMQLGSDKINTYRGYVPKLSFIALIDLYRIMSRLSYMSSQVPVDNPALCKHAKEWDSITMEQFMKKHIWTQAAWDAVVTAGRTIFGMEPSQMSLLFYLYYAAAAGGLDPLIASDHTGGQEFKVKGGVWQVCYRLLDHVGQDNVHLSSPVLSITQDDDGVSVITEKQQLFRCERVVLAIPPSEAVKLRYSPMLPVKKLQVLQGMSVGYLTKVIITYSKTFWRDKGLSGESVTVGGKSVVKNCSIGPLSVGFDFTSSQGSPALVTFIGGEQQIQYSAVSFEERRRAVLHSLSEMFGPEALNPLDYGEMNWNEEPYNGGCPTNSAQPGVITNVASGMRKAFGRIHFAGTESATVWCGFITGAVQSGERAAIEVLYHLNPQIIAQSDLERANLTKRTGNHLSMKTTSKSSCLFRCGVSLAVVSLGVFTARKAYSRMLS